MNRNIYWIDLFCGFGGTSEGIHMAGQKVIACVNHDADAIKCHTENHPEAIHFTEDIRDWEVIVKLKKLVEDLREKEPNCIINIWASLECTHFSKAKGGTSRDSDSRTLAEHLFTYEENLRPDAIYIENVEEFLTWGPLNEEGKPIKESKGIDYVRWRDKFKSLGFNYDYALLNAADFGAYTSRLRYFGVFKKGDSEIYFPEPTHVSKKKHHLYPNRELHNPVKNVLDFNNIGKSIFGLNGRGKPYAEKTVSRTLGGVKKTIKEKKDKFLSSYYGNSQNGQGISSIDRPCGTITTKDRFAFHHIQYAFGNACYSSIESPAGSIMTNPKHELVTTKWLYDTQFNRVACSIDKPSPTIIARQDKSPLSLGVASYSGKVDNSIDLPGDSLARKELKAFMRAHGIIDITIRSLTVSELLEIQGFPKDYILTSGKTKSKKFIGNSVVPLVAKKLVEANYAA